MSQISEEDIEMFKETFDCFCDNKGNTVWVRKLEQLLHCVGYNPTEREMKQYLQMLNKGEKEKFDLSEFLELMEKVHKMSGRPQDQVTELIRAFNYFDRDGSGYLEREELKKFLTMRGVTDVCDDDVRYILDVADINGDGRIDTAEFAKLLSSFPQTCE